LIAVNMGKGNMKNQNLSVSIKVKSEGLAKEMERIVLSVGGFRLYNPGDGRRPDLLIYELDENVDEEFKALQSLLDSNGVGEIFVTSEKRDADLLVKAMRAGTKEFLSQPLDEFEVKEALQSFKKRIVQTPTLKEPIHAGRIINVIGAKGGVGTTTVTVNLAMILAQKRKAGSVALVDLNTVFGEIPLFLSVKPTYHWGQMSKNVSRLDSTFLLNAMAKHASGVYVLPSPSYLNGHPPVTREIMDRLLTTMKSTFDYIIVDGGQSLDSPALKVMEMADRIFLITLLNLPCLHNTNNLLKSLSSTGMTQKDRIKLVVNRYLKKSDITLKEAEESVKREISWTIPNDYKTTMSAINRGKPLHEISPRSAIIKRLEGLADSILQGDRKAEKRGWFFRRS
jgi:pilus assembly protein CpaE